MTNNVKYFVILQANEVGSSNAMELEGAKRSFNFLKGSGLKMDIFISDRHKGIAKWIRTKQKETKHFNDIWHVNKSINKQLRKVSKEKGCEIINDWCVNICIGVLKPPFLALRLSLLLNGSQLLDIWLANMKITQILYLHHVPMVSWKKGNGSL